MPIPNKGFFDPEPDQTTERPSEQTSEQTDSVADTIDRMVQIETEAAKKQQQIQEEEARRQIRAEQSRQEALRAEDEYIDKLIKRSDIQSREALLERIRQMRAEKPPEYVPPPRTPEQQAQLEKEQADGRAAVARAEAAQAKQQELIAKQATQTAVTTTVHHPNPSQDEIYPTIKSTLPPRPRR